jgi:methionyl-tRNA formyltransferase
MVNHFNNFVFWGSSEFSVVVLETLKKSGFLPSLIVTLPDSPAGRGLKLAPSPVKLWAIENNIDFLQPAHLDDNLSCQLAASSYQLFLAAAYGKIIPKKILDIPKYGSFNIHPSLLPKYRGPSPLQSQILADEKDVGVTIIKMDNQVDHGPVAASCQLTATSLEKWPMSFKELGEVLFKKGAGLLIETLPKLVSGEIVPKPQDDSEATFTKKFEKKDGEINLDGGPNKSAVDGFERASKKSWLKYLALGSTIGVFFFAKHKNKTIRVKITAAEFRDSKFAPTKVVPEGRKEMSYEDFVRGLRS